MMNTILKGNYFDGITAKAIEVDVTFTASELSLFSAERNISIRVALDALSHIRNIGNDRLILNFNSECTEGVDITAKDIVPQFNRNYPGIAHKNFLGRVKGISNKMVLILVASLLAVVCLIYFFVVPFIGEMSTHLISKENEIELGETIYKSVISGYEVDSVKTRIVNDIVSEIDFQSPYDLKITVVDFKEKNAFALPGGHIVVFSGLLHEMSDYAELAGLLAHEVSHVNHQHSLRAIFRNLSSYIFISVIFSDVNGISTVLLDNANKFKTLSFSRALEEEADREGLKILKHNQIDPYGMVRLFKVLMQENNELNSNLEFLSSHPLTEKRILYIEKQIKETAFNIKKHNKLEELWINLNADY